MWWYGRGNSGGSWLPEEKKLICDTEGEIVVAHGYQKRKKLICGTEGEIVVAHGCRKRKKLICGTEEEIVVAHGHLPSPARMVRCLGWGGIFEVWYNKC